LKNILKASIKFSHYLPYFSFYWNHTSSFWSSWMADSILQKMSLHLPLRIFLISFCIRNCIAWSSFACCGCSFKRNH
jgi:hypothetical protein